MILQTSMHSNQTIYYLANYNPMLSPLTSEMSKWTIVKKLITVQAYTNLFWERWLSKIYQYFHQEIKGQSKDQKFDV